MTKQTKAARKALKKQFRRTPTPPPDIPSTAEGEAYCKHCKMVFMLNDPELGLVHGVCGRKGKMRGWWY